MLTLACFLAMGSFYSVLGCQPGASSHAIRKAFHKRRLRYHPDKGGDGAADAYIAFVYETLASRAKCTMHDNMGHAAFMKDHGAQFGPQPAPQPAPRPAPQAAPKRRERPRKQGDGSPSDCVAFEILSEPSNVNFVKKFVGDHYGVLSDIEVNGVLATTMLLSFVARADAKGMVKTLWVECRGKSPYESRMYSGLQVAEGRVPDDEMRFIRSLFDHEQVPDALRGISAFMLPKELRCVLRFGCPVLDFDQVCSHPTIQLDRAAAEPDVYPPTTLLRRYVDYPKAFRKELGCSKRVLLKMTYAHGVLA